MPPPHLPSCDWLLFTSTRVEWEQLLRAFEGYTEGALRSREAAGAQWAALGTIAGRRLLAVKTRMGALDFGAAAHCATRFQLETGASRLIAVGMAFGVHPAHWSQAPAPLRQRIGDVLIASHVLLYDQRLKVTAEDGSVLTMYEKTCRRQAHQDARDLTKGINTKALPYRVHIGQVLSGGAKIQSSIYRDRLVDEITKKLPCKLPIIGGDMEANGLLSASDPQAPRWMMIKGIADFADEDRANLHEEDIRKNQAIACENAFDLFFRFLQGTAPGSEA